MEYFTISDLHLGHENLVLKSKIGSRTLFSENVKQMNNYIISQWNKVVKPNDCVIHLGDFAFGADSKSKIDTWISMLNGYKIWIKGNHYDPKPNVQAICKSVGGINFIMTHNPESLMHHIEYWLIHGHTHSAPFLNREKKEINVCAEAVNYTPVKLSDLVNVIKSSYQTMDKYS